LKPAVAQAAAAALSCLALAAGLVAPTATHAQATTTVTRSVSIDYDAYGQMIRETVEPNDTALRLVTETTRDPTYGVPTQRTQSWRDPVSATDKTRVVETLGYDARRRFATSSTNARNHTQTRTHDEATGQVLTATSPNQLTTTWQYDGWGRKTRETGADGTATTWAYRQCVDACQNSAGSTAASVLVTQHWAGTVQTSVPTETFADTLGRQVQTRSWGFDGTAVLTERAHDAKGRLARSAQPRYPGATAVWTYFEYDDLGRVTRQREPNAAGTGYDDTVTTYNGLAVTRTNPKNQARTELSNGLGKLKQVTDAAGGITSYLYDPYGNLTRTTDPAGNQIHVSYDRLGRKQQLADPDLGTWTYHVDPLGQTWRQVDAKGQKTDYTHDELGRLVHRLEPDLESAWVYDVGTKAIGQLAEAYTLVAGAKDYQRLHAYDSLGRPASTTLRLDWDYVEEWGYDSFGRQHTTTYRRNARGGSGGPAHTLTEVYNARGYRAQVLRSGSPTPVWTAQVLNAHGMVTQAQLGNGLVRRRSYNPYTGRIESIAVGPDVASATHQDDRYSYDAVGNLLSRSQLAASGALMSESFGYDSLNRLASSQVAGRAAKTYGYDAIGNLTRQDSLTYSYPPSGVGSVRPHAAIGLTGSVAGLSNPGLSNYDANGNLGEGLNRRYGWNGFNQAARIEKLSGSSAVQRTEFVFDPEHQRVRQTVRPVSGGTVGAATSTIHYGGDIQKEIDTAANTTTIRTYLPGGLGYLEEKLSGTAVAATASATAAERYFLNDRLGSPVAIVDAARTVLQRLSHDPWGRRRNADGSDDAAATLGSIANAQDHTGYTGHEQLDHLALVHMNGRIYDPITARMLSADPTVPDPSDAQALNRYSYVLNNPFAYVDPSGYAPFGGYGSNDPHVRDIGIIRHSMVCDAGYGCSFPGANYPAAYNGAAIQSATFDGLNALQREQVLDRVVITGSKRRKDTLIGMGTLRLRRTVDRGLRVVGVLPQVGRLAGGAMARSAARAGVVVLAGAGNPVNDVAAVGVLVIWSAYECLQVCSKIADILTEAASADEGQDGEAALDADGVDTGASAPAPAASESTRKPAPALAGDPYSPAEVDRRRSELRGQLGAPSLDPDSPIPDQGSGRDMGGHEARGRTPHETGERNVNSNEEHSRRPKGNPSGRARR
jgi:RHS repeat-associated protein